MNEDVGIDFYENNSDETFAVVGYSEAGVCAVYDNRGDQGIFFHTREEAEYVREALSRWLNEGGK